MLEISPTTKILILSADSDTCFNLVIMLKKTGLAKVTCISSATQALELCANKPHNLVLVDQNTKGLPGWMFIKEFKSSTQIRNAAVVFFGTEPCPATPAQLKQYGILGYLQPPIVLKTLMELVAASLTELERPGALERSYSSAKDSLIDGRTEEAVSQFATLVTATDRSARSSLGLAQAFDKNQDHEEAEKVIAAIPLSDETNIPLLVMRIRLLLKKGDHDGALGLMKSLIEFAPDAALYHKLCAELSLQHELFEFAEATARNAITKGFDQAEFPVVLAKCLYRKGDVDGAYKLLKQLDSDGAMNLESLNLLGVCLRKLGKFKAAMACYEKALELAPKDEKLYFNLALCNIALGQLEAASKLLERAMKLAPNFAKARDKLLEVRDLMKEVGAA